ncbi:PH domain-containing protein [Streptomyces sp. NPDC096152]|uniref:PH domain-containing protein n=1 Tax=Streptomyces sp. NPDC096152 TaxID=3366078 RepID=UPI0037FD77D0
MVKIPEGLRGDLAEAVAQENSLWGSKKSLVVASGALRDDERVLAATTTFRKQGNVNQQGALIVTDQRLLFVHARAFASATEEIPLANISGVVDRKGLLQGAIVVTGAGGITTSFSNITKDRVGPVMEAIRSHLRVPGNATVAPTGASPDSADQIRKLAELRDAGILTEEEFTAKKRQILGL